MKKIINEWNNFLNESSISRTYEHIINHDTAFITAFRDNPGDPTKCRKPTKLKKTQVPAAKQRSMIQSNKERNMFLKAALLERGYGVTDVDGTYVEDFGTKAAKEVKEDSFFVVNLNDDLSFKSFLNGLSEHFCQDSFLYVNRGGESSMLIGTNNSEFPGFGNEAPMGSFLGGKEGEFMTRVGKSKRPIKFAEGLDTKKKSQNNTKFLISKFSKELLKEINGG
mgnify:FL=1